MYLRCSPAIGGATVGARLTPSHYRSTTNISLQGPVQTRSIAMASFNLAAAAAAHLGPDFLDAFQPAGPVAARDQTPGHLIARNDSSVPTVNLFLDNPIESLEYAASVIDACVDQTTYAIQCTDGIYGCGANAMVSPTNNQEPFQFQYYTNRKLTSICV